MKNLVLSAFRRFGSYTANSTEIVAERIDGCVLAGFKVHSVFFPATIPRGVNRGVNLLEFAQRVDAKGIVSLGMASEKRGLCIETVATNAINNPKYCPPTLNGTPIDTRDAYGRKMTLDLRLWRIGTFQKRCRAEDIPIMKCSSDAGGFCCNHLMYQLKRARSCLKAIPFVFIHVPCCRESVPDYDAFVNAGKVTMTVDQIIKGLSLLLKCSAI